MATSKFQNKILKKQRLPLEYMLLVWNRNLENVEGWNFVTFYIYTKIQTLKVFSVTCEGYLKHLTYNCFFIHVILQVILIIEWMLSTIPLLALLKNVVHSKHGIFPLYMFVPSYFKYKSIQRINSLHVSQTRLTSIVLDVSI